MADLTPNNDVTPDTGAPAVDAAPATSYATGPVEGTAAGTPGAPATGEVAPVSDEVARTPGSTEVIERGTEYSGPTTTHPTTAPAAVETPTADPGTVAPVQGYAPASETGPVEPQIVYVTAPTPPRLRNNHLASVPIAALASLVFTVVLAIIIAIIASTTVGFSLSLLAAPLFYVPVILFVVAFVLLALIVNRGGWWAYIIGSIVVAAIVYFGSIAVIVLIRSTASGSFGITPQEFTGGLSSPVVIAAGLLAREVALWGGAIISRFGRKVKARNAEALATFEAEQRANAEAASTRRP